MSTDINSLPNENPNSKNIKLKVTENNNTPLPPVTKNNNAPHHNPLTELSKESIQQIVSGIQEASHSNLTELPTTIAGYGILDAFIGNYNDLTNKPDLFSGSYDDLTEKPTNFGGASSSSSSTTTGVPPTGVCPQCF